MLLHKASRFVHALSRGMNKAAAFSVFFMMSITCADVILRYFRHPVTGTFELVGLSGAMAVSFALAQTTQERGHIAVDFIFRQLPGKARNWVERVNDLIQAGLFGLIAWHSFILAMASKSNNEGSMTLHVPHYPFILGISASFAVLFIICVLHFLLSFTPPAGSTGSQTGGEPCP